MVCCAIYWLHECRMYIAYYSILLTETLEVHRSICQYNFLIIVYFCHVYIITFESVLILNIEIGDNSEN